MEFEVSIVDKVKCCSDRRDYWLIHSTSNDAEKNLFKLLVLVACPLTD